MARNPNRESIFQFKEFKVLNNHTAMKVGTDGVLLGAWAPLPEHSAPRVLDVGTGCGLIALMLAQRQSEAKILGIDISHEAITEATVNFQSSPWGNRLEARLLDFCNIKAQYVDGSFDLIICNPPFYKEDTLAPDRNRAIARNLQSLPPEKLFAGSKKLLSHNGFLCVIYPYDALNDLIFSGSQAGLYATEIIEVITKEGKAPSRVLCKFQPGIKPSFIEHQKLVMHNENGYPTEEYILLVDSFYLRVK